MRHIAICYNSGIKRGKGDISNVKYLEIFMGNALGGGHFPYLRNGRPWYCDKGNIGKYTELRVLTIYRGMFLGRRYKTHLYTYSLLHHYYRSAAQDCISDES